MPTGNSPSALLSSSNCSPIRTHSGDQHHASSRARRQLQFVAHAVPASHFYKGSPSSVHSRQDAHNRARLDTLPVLDSAAGATMGSSFRRLLTSSQPDIQTLHTILVSLHRSEATPTDLHHASQAIGLLASLASDRHGCADCADMATAILSTLATYPKTRTQLPAHARRQLADALIEIIGYKSTFSSPQPAIARQPSAATLPGHPRAVEQPESGSAGLREPFLSPLPMQNVSDVSRSSNGSIPSAELQSRARSQSPAKGTSTDVATSSARSASLPPAISESQMNTQSLLSSPGSPRRQLKTFAQRAIERLQDARQASPPGKTNTSVPPCVPANKLHVPESLNTSQQDLEDAPSEGGLDGPVADDRIDVPHLLDFDSSSLDKIRQEHEELQKSLSGVQLSTAIHSSTLLHVVIAWFGWCAQLMPAAE